MLLLLFFISLFTKGAVQEFGDIQQLLGFAFGHRLSAMMSSCCIVRELQCPPLRRQRVTSYQNLSSDITSGLERFSRCVCSNHRQCVLSFPASFLPDAADGVSYDVTFVTVSTTAQYTCLYNGTRALVCQGRQSMRTGMLGWVLPNFAGEGGYGMMGALGSAGLLGEEMEEAMEQMVESGLPPPRPSRPPCRRCAPLRCAVAVGRETARLRAYRLRQIGTAQRQLYHRCLRHHGIRPPQSVTATTTTARPPIRLPMTPPTDSEPDHTTFLPTTTTATTTTTRKTTTTTTRRTTTSTTTTTRKPTTKGTTPKLPVIVTTPKIDVPKHQPTTPEKPTTKALPAAATTSEAYVTTFTPKVSTTTPATTSTPQVITRILVGSGTETTSTAPRQKAVADVTEAGGGGTSIGGSGVAGVVIGVSAAMAVMAAALFFLLLRRRRRKKQTEELSGSVVAVGKLSAGHGGKHHKARPLPSVSSKKAVIDAEDADEDFEKADDDDDDDDDEDSANDGTPAGEEERYTLPPYSQSASAVHRKPRLSTRSSKAGDDESLYASLDESAIDPSLPAHPAARAAVNVVGSGVGSESLASGDPPSKAAARKESKTFYNAEGLVPPLGGDSRAAASQAVGGRRCGSYYNLKPGSAPPAARSLGLQDHVTAADGSGNANYVNAATSLSKNPYEKPRLQGGKHMYTSLKVGNAASGDAASPQRGNTTNTNTASGDDPQSAALTSRAPRSDIYSQPYGSISRNNGRHSAVAGRESSRVGRTTSSSSSIVSAAVCIPDRSGNSSAKQDSEASAPSGGRVAARTTPAERESGNTPAATKRDSERSGLAGRESANSLVRTRESTHTPAGPKRDWERSANNNNNNNSATPSSARTPVSRQGSNPAAACRTGPPRVDHDGYLLPVTPRRQQRL